MHALITQEIERRVQQRVTPDVVEAFARDGAVCLRQLLNQDEVALLREGIEANLAAPSPRAKVASRPDDPGRFFEDFCNWQDVGQFQRFVTEAPVALAAQRLMRSPSVRLYHDHVLVKEPGTRQRTPWHQDQPYYNIEGRQNISLWIPVDPVPRASTLEFVAGSHRGPWLMPRSFMDHQAKWFPEGSLQDLPDIEADRAAHAILGWQVEPGDVVCFHMLTLHGAGGFEGPGRRRVFSVRFMGEDTRHAPRRWTTSPDFPGLERELPAGAPMEHLLFPLLVG
ncbi:MAG TPA: phytanoyl-CoA dioxygenase [Comamonadaceae bacterium]|uniref:phytanoyl-CoA dioxygenase family protein n=1 Tax=Pulveribacter sp. TaxID=2678893 RepID=UPI000EBB0689|nr:phytanoyl-CoA dioxygenase family protein [Pulveribacter sp.]HCL84974.1 phytanoyl-CoA dioxygenase [Comamonadaceae bacterium]